MARKQLSKEKIIEATLNLIEKNGSGNAVNFREIARDLGCAHTSLYHFYDRFQDIQIDAARLLIEKMRYQLNERTSTFLKVDSNESILTAYTSAVIDFALEHKGWYRFLWMDQMAYQPFEILGDQPRPETLLLKPFLESHGVNLTISEATIMLEIGHAYVHGELCKFLTARSAYTTEVDLKRSVINNIKWIQKRGNVQ